MAPKVVDLEEVKGLLTEYNEKVTHTIDEKIKNQSDAANAEISELKKKQSEFEKGIKSVNDAIKEKKEVGLPGYEGKEKSKWSWQRFFKALWFQCSSHPMAMHGRTNPWEKAGAEYEKEVCKSYMNRRKVDFMQSMSMPANSNQKDYEYDDGSSGGFLVPPEQYQGDIIEPTYAQTPILQMPTLRLDNLKGDMPIPIDAGNLTAYWLGENTKPTKSTTSFDLAWLRRKKLGVFCKISNDLLAFSNRNIEQILRNKITRDASVALSDGLTNGKGSDYEPKGILQYSGMTSGGVVGSSGGRFTIDDAQKLRMELAKVNELRDTDSYGFLMHPAVKFGLLRERVKQYSAQSRRNAMPVFPTGMLMDEEAVARVLKARMGDTTQMPNNEDTDGSTTSSSNTYSSVLYGDWSLFAYGQFRDPIFRVSDVAGDGSTGSALLDDQTYIVMFLQCDCQLLRSAAFAKMTGAETNDSNW